MPDHKNMPLVSVVIPVYGTEKYLGKCLDSILSQTYKNIEIIIVNDATKDNSEEIISEYLSEHDNIKYVRHAENRGLFRARISGAEEAEGEYIAFVDSDDYLSPDFYRQLVNKACDDDADMVLGTFFLAYEDGKCEYFNLDPTRLTELRLDGDNVLRTYMEQSGLCYSWQLVWNKLYKKSLWDKDYKRFLKFSEENPGLIMTEDIAFSSVFWTNAVRVRSVPDAVYYYRQRAGQSTDNVTQNRLKKNLDDVIAVFGFFKESLELSGRYDEFAENYISWRKLYGRIYFDNFREKGIIDCYGEVIRDELFLGDELCGLAFEDEYFYSIKTPVSESYRWFEDIKAAIADEKTECVSFDIFDTLTVRPFWIPTDLFYMMNGYFMEVAGANADIDFAQIRIESERSCREKFRLLHPSFDDITIDEIYGEMAERYCFSPELCRKMKEKEIELELRFCKPRRVGAQLFRMALDMGKRVVLTSDMYLDRGTVERILENNGITGYERLYLSSEKRLGKWSGRLFKCLLDDVDISPERVVHIGDNWASDIEMPRSLGMSSFHLDRSVNIIGNLNQGIYAGEGFTQSFVNNPSDRDLNGGLWGFSGLRTLVAAAANRIFDNPYVSFNRQTDFNADPVYIGCFALGMHLLAVALWLCRAAKSKNVRKLHFVARDGYLVKQAYDIINREGRLPESSYLYLSRKALALADIKRPEDMYSLINKLNIKNATPQSFVDMFASVLPENERLSFCGSLAERGFLKDKKFTSREEYEIFLREFITALWDKLDLDSHRAALSDYFKDIIAPQDLLFDIGYSGRAESALKSLLGYAPNSCYIHSNAEVLDRRMKRDGFENELFYGYKPGVTGVMREHLFMKQAPSAVGYARNSDGTVSPVFEEYHTDYQTKFVTDTVQNAALDFVRDIYEMFGDMLDELYFRHEDASQPFEYYLNYGKTLDRNIFSTLVFEDDFGEGKRVRAVDFWAGEIARLMKLKINIAFENRVIGEDAYIGIKKPEYYKLPDKKAKKPDPFRAVMFMDKITADDTEEDKFQKCAGNTSNLFDWSYMERNFRPKLVNNWYLTHEGGFSDGEQDIFLSTNLVWIRENDDLTYLDRTLELIGDKPLLPISIGFDCTEGCAFSLGRESVKTLRAIAERCRSVGVRGELSAEILRGFGVNNVRIIGCPSMYENISEMKNIRRDKQKIGRASASFKPFYGSLSAVEIDMLMWFAENGFELTDTTPLSLSAENISDKELLERLCEYEKGKSIYFDTRRWNDSFEDTDFAMGMSFANNAAAMRCGVPALFVNYDAAGRELCRFFGLPSIEAEEFDKNKSVSEYYEAADLSLFRSKIDRNFREFTEFLSENGVKLCSALEKVIVK
ncbi:MAG: glycosyltransferase [Oscillospiraceae bacterium]|nr:glycosyltransferase [Oscillospiraceae bacterium]